MPGHTSDWHVGKVLKGRDRHDEHAAVLGSVVSVAREHDVDLVVDGGFCGLEPTTVVELENGQATVARQGKGDNARFTA